ncbi:prolyl oligopeptidase family serine peptidase, partial [Vibrio parahaemolyticus]
MHTRKLILAATFGLLLAGCSQTSTTTNAEMIPPEYPVDYFFKNSEVSSYQISPAGDYISMMKPWQDRKNVFVYPTDNPDQIKRVTSVTGRDIAYYYWVGEDTVIYSRDTGGDENFYLVTVNVKTGEEKTITPTSGVVAYVIDTLDNQPDDILISSNERNPQVFDVYRHNLKTGENTLVAQNPGNVRSWGTDHDGNIRVITTSDGVNTSVLYRDTVEDEFKPLKNLTFKESFSPISFTPDNKNLYVASRITRDKSAIVEYDVTANKEIREIFSHPEVDVNSAHYSEALNKLVSVSYVTDKNHYHFLDDSYQQTFERLSEKLPNVEISVTSATRDESKMIVVTYSDVDRPNYYFYDRKADKLEKLAENAPWHKPEHMAKMTPIQYTARDGETIHGYLTLPKGREAKDLPLLVLPHGGPWARDHWGFQPEVQLFANRGIAVLQMNFRGSTGYGREFWEKSFKQWGQSMQDDITDGVKWATEQGYAQDGNVCIYGASYGGYATLAG